jgi:Tol biopolymer transport system component
MKLPIHLLAGVFLVTMALPIVKSVAQGYARSTSLPSPEIFATGSISTGDYESHAAFTPSGDTIFFVKSAPDFSSWTICVSYFRYKRWISPVVAPFSGKYKDADPFVTRDGKTLYFISNRPVIKTDSVNTSFDIWKIDLTENGWSEPTHLDMPVNSDGDEYYPTLTNSGTLYFGSSRKGGKGNTDIYRCKLINGKFSNAENLGDAINTESDEFEPFISPDEKYLIMMASRPVSANGDLYISYNQNGKWTPAEKLSYPINSERTEYSPKISPDGKYFFFSSTRNITSPESLKTESVHELLSRVRNVGNGLGDIYQVDISALPLKTK